MGSVNSDQDRPVGIIAAYPDGRTLELHAVSENNRSPVYELREWHEGRPSAQGIRLTVQALEVLAATALDELTRLPAVSEEPSALPVVPKKPPMPTGSTDTTEWFCRGKFGADATGLFDGKGMTVLAGSHAASQVAPAFRSCYLWNTRTRLCQKGLLDENDLFTQDVYFSSPSSAACMVLGYSANGWIVWTDSQGRRLDELRKDNG